LSPYLQPHGMSFGTTERAPSSTAVDKNERRVRWMAEAGVSPNPPGFYKRCFQAIWGRQNVG
jgi:hypothetical protein